MKYILSLNHVSKNEIEKKMKEKQTKKQTIWIANRMKGEGWWLVCVLHAKSKQKCLRADEYLFSSVIFSTIFANNGIIITEQKPLELVKIQKKM